LKKTLSPMGNGATHLGSQLQPLAEMQRFAPVTDLP